MASTKVAEVKLIHNQTNKSMSIHFHRAHIFVVMMELMKERGTNKQAWMDTRVNAEIDGATSALAQIGRLE